MASHGEPADLDSRGNSEYTKGIVDDMFKADDRNRDGRIEYREVKEKWEDIFEHNEL